MTSLVVLANVMSDVMVYLDTNIFLFLLSIFLDLIFLFFYYLNNEEPCNHGHMTYHMMWSHKPRLGKSRLEE